MSDPFNAVPQIDATTTNEQWKEGKVCLLDVREPSEWNLGHIEGAILLPLGQLPARWRELDPDKKWVIVCRSGNRSNHAAAMLRQVGFDASNMRGGMLKWKNDKLPITAPGIVEA